VMAGLVEFYTVARDLVGSAGAADVGERAAA
jgi:hypothetical protein